MNTRDETAQSIVRFLKSDKNVLLLNGTNIQEKHRLALEVVKATLPSVKVLFRTNNQSHLAGLGGYSHADTLNVASQKKTPRDFDVAVVWPIDPLTASKGSDLMSDLRFRGVKKVILCTWIDNHDFTWVDNYNPEKATYDAEAENAVQHEAVKEIASHIRANVPKNLPGYAKNTDPNFLVRLHCDRCNAGRWAKINKPFSGMDILRNAEAGEYRATCLKCGTETDDTYNWFGQE